MFAEAESIGKTKAAFGGLNPARSIADETIEIGDTVRWNGRSNVFGVDWKAKLTSGEALFVESKIWGRNRSVLELTDQFEKHMKTKIQSLIDDAALPPVFRDGGKVPKLHYDFRGSLAEKADEIKDHLISLCKGDKKKTGINDLFLVIREAGFDCDSDLTFSFDADLIEPLVN